MQPTSILFFTLDQTDLDTTGEMSRPWLVVLVGEMLFQYCPLGRERNISAAVTMVLKLCAGLNERARQSPQGTQRRRKRQ